MMDYDTRRNMIALWAQNGLDLDLSMKAVQADVGSACGERTDAIGELHAIYKRRADLADHIRKAYSDKGLGYVFVDDDGCVSYRSRDGYWVEGPRYTNYFIDDLGKVNLT